MKTKLFFIALLLTLFANNIFAQTELLQNGNFSNGYNNWTTTGNWNISSSYSCYRSSPAYAYAGTSGAAVANESGDLFQAFTVPSNATSATLAFYASKSTDETTTTTVYDYVDVFLYGTNMNQLMQFTPTNINNLYAGSPSTFCDNYSPKTFSIPSIYFGMALNIVFRVHSDASKHTMFRIDDVSVVYAAPSGCIAVTIPSTTSNQPQNQSKTVGGTANFSVTPVGDAPFIYQWRKNGNNISGTNASSYTTPTLTLSDNNSLYSCYITNCSSGNATSNNATLTVTNQTGGCTNVTLNSTSDHPQSQSITIGNSVTFTVNPSGTATFTYQWKKNGNNILGATGSTYTISSVATSDAGNYSCYITNCTGNGSITSNNATLTVTNSGGCTPISITTQPQDKTITAGNTATFTIAVSSSSSTPITYQWYKNSIAISGETSNSYTTSVAQSQHNGLHYYCKISNPCGTLDSSIATLFVNNVVSTPCSSKSTYPVKGYFPDYRTMTDAQNIQYEKLTDIFFLINLDSNNSASTFFVNSLGEIIYNNGSTFNYIKGRCCSENVNLHLCVLANDDKSPPHVNKFSAIANDSSKRNKFTTSCANLCQSLNLKGIDIDWEYPKNNDSFVNLLADLRTKLGSNYTISIAVPKHKTDNTQGYSLLMYQYIDYLNIMAYDNDISLTNQQHSSYSFMTDIIDSWSSFSCPYNKMVVGVPFYGKKHSYFDVLPEQYNKIGLGINSLDSEIAYYSDYHNSWYYNGWPTISAKVNYMKSKNCAGVFIWELTQDRDDQYSLLKAINSKINSNLFGDNDNPYDIKITPNPTNGQFMLDLKGAFQKTIKFEFLNQNSQVLISKVEYSTTTDYSTTFDISLFLSSVYFTKITIDGNVYTKKIIKQ